MPSLPEVFGDFLLLERLLASPMAEVLLAVRLGERSGRTYVVKRPRLGERASGRAAQAVLREGEVLSAVVAPGVVALEALGEIAGLPYLAVEHVRGAPLDRLLASSGPLPAAAVRAIALDLARALAAVHAAGWVHADVAPSNVLVDDSGEARLIDFGTAVHAGERRAEMTGKPGYVAPEAVRPVDAGAPQDVYAWAVVVAECALGRRLFDEEHLAEAGSRGDPGRALTELGDDQATVRAALARDPAARPTAAELCAALAHKPIDRGVLAERVAEASRPSDAAAASAKRPEARAEPSSRPPPAELTPTAPMEVRRSLPETRPEPAVARAPIEIEAVVRPVRDKASRVPSAPWLALIAIAAAIVGLAVGRWSSRARGGSIAFPGGLPRRVEVRLDGRPLALPSDGSSLPVTPGRHTITVQLPKGPARDYPVQVRPGEDIVLLPLWKGGGLPSDTEDRP